MARSRCLSLVAVGDRDSKKTELLQAYTGGKRYKSKYYTDYILPKFENNIQDIIVDHIPRSVYFIDTESDDDYEILRREAYEKADCILLCYSISDKKTFKNIYKKWCIQVRKYAPFTPVILVGTEMEKRVSNSSRRYGITTEQGENLKLLIGAYAFLECSIEKSLGIDDVFIEAVRSTYQRIVKF